MNICKILLIFRQIGSFIQGNVWNFFIGDENHRNGSLSAGDASASSSLMLRSCGVFDCRWSRRSVASSGDFLCGIPSAIIIIVASLFANTWFGYQKSMIHSYMIKYHRNGSLSVGDASASSSLMLARAGSSTAAGPAGVSPLPAIFYAAFSANRKGEGKRIVLLRLVQEMRCQRRAVSLPFSTESASATSTPL